MSSWASSRHTFVFRDEAAPFFRVWSGFQGRRVEARSEDLLFLPPHVLQRKEWPRDLEELFLHPIVLLSETFPGRLTVQNRLVSTEGPRLSPAPVYGDKPNQKGFLSDPEGCMATRGLSGPHGEVVGRACLNLGLCPHRGPRVECLGFHVHTLYRWLET